MQDTPQEAKSAPKLDGYWIDPKGCLIPDKLVRPIEKARDQLVKELVAEALTVSKALGAFKMRAFDDISAFVDLSAEQYQTTLGGKKGNLTLYSFDGKYKVQRSIQDRIAFDERLQAAKALIDECLQDWTEGAKVELQIIVNQAFDTDKAGLVNTRNVLALRRYEIKDARWERAMTAISEAIQVVGSKSYIRVYQRVGNTDQYESITLDIAGA